MFTVPESVRIMLHKLETTVIIGIHVLRMNIPLRDTGTMTFPPFYHVAALNLDICNTVWYSVWLGFEFSGYDGCGRGPDRNYFEYTRGGGSYRDSYATYGKSPVLTVSH